MPLVRTSSGLKIAGSPDGIVQLCLEKADGISSIAVAGNDKVAGIFPKFFTILVLTRTAEINGSKVIEYKSLDPYRDSLGDNFGDFEDFEQIVANETTFTALSKAGKVWTWGDGRYEACLGREVSKER